MRQIRIMIERQSKRFIAYPLGVRGGKASEGSTYEEAVTRLTVSTGLYPDSPWCQSRRNASTCAGSVCG